MKRIVRVVGGAIMDGRGHVLVAQRPWSEDAVKSLKWELPGGKIEEGEESATAIRREIREELGCEIKVEELIARIDHEYPDFKLSMDVFLCHVKPGNEPECLEHAAIRWINADEIYTLDWLEADYQILPVIRNKL